MMRIFLSLVAVYGLASGPGFADDRFDLLSTERIGNLRLGATEHEAARAFASCRLQRSEAVFWESDGLFHQDWQDPACGVSIDMVSEEQGRTQSVASVAISAPAAAQTVRGIGIGSSEADLAKVYLAEKNAEDSQAGTQFVAGSIYGGLIFTINHGRVEKIFLGAAAE